MFIIINVPLLGLGRSWCKVYWILITVVFLVLCIPLDGGGAGGGGGGGAGGRDGGGGGGG